MNNSKQHRRWIIAVCRRVAGAALALAIVLVLAVVTGSAQAPTYTESVLYRFTGGTDGGFPMGKFVQKWNGKLYGTAATGGNLGYCVGWGCGTVFEVNPTTGAEHVLYSFTGIPDGANPYAGLVRDGQGNLYGTTYYGGTYGLGTVFKMYKNSGVWIEKVFYSFSGAKLGQDGAEPSAGLVRDGQGNLYGTTYVGGDPTCNPDGSGCGTVFKVDKYGNETVLHRFTGPFQGGPDGAWPFGGLVRDSHGNLYGTTQGGGDWGWGTVFRVDRYGNEVVLYPFAGIGDGYSPSGALVRDAQGNLYGTTSEGGGNYSCGTLFEVYKNSGAWFEKVLYRFNCTGGDGNDPIGALVWDTNGNLYGTTETGGKNGNGTVFMLNPNTSPPLYGYQVLYNFGDIPDDGAWPWAALMWDAQHGDLYGTTLVGGNVTCNPPLGCGTVFKLTP